MNCIFIRPFRNLHVMTGVALLALCASTASAEAPPAPTSKPQTESIRAIDRRGEDYAAPKKLSLALSRITIYRPSQGTKTGVARVELNGKYHTSLQFGRFTELCVEPNQHELAARMVRTGDEFKNDQDAKTTLMAVAGQNLYVRVSDYTDGNLMLTPVNVDVAQAELNATQRQIHAISRIQEAKECFEPEPEVVNKESIVLDVDTLFVSGKSDIKGLSAKGRFLLDELTARLQKQYDDAVSFHITGHTDPFGSSASNKRLSKARAMAVHAYMLEKGMSAKRVVSEGVGSEQLLVSECGKAATPESIECNKPNRRVVISVQTFKR
jgi:outer membrane protein OmpA-like peptidoglycan-associated protein